MGGFLPRTCVHSPQLIGTPGWAAGRLSGRSLTLRVQMATDETMTERKWPTEEDLLAGRMPDGSRPPLHSKDLPEFDPLYLHSLRVKNEGVPELPPAIHGKDPADMTEEELHMLVDHRCLQQMDCALDFAMDMIDVGREGLALARSGKSDTAVPAVGGVDVPPSPRLRRAVPSAPGTGGCSAPIGVADPATRGSAGDVQTECGLLRGAFTLN